MHPIYWCPEHFRQATTAETFNGLLFRSILRMCVQNLKFVALSIREITGGTQKFGQSLETPTLLPNFNGFGWTLPNLQSIAHS